MGAFRGGGERIYGGGAVGGLVTPDAAERDRLPSSSDCPWPSGTPKGTGMGATSETGAGTPCAYKPVFHGAALPPTPGATPIPPAPGRRLIGELLDVS